GTWLLDPQKVLISNSSNDSDLNSTGDNPIYFSPNDDGIHSLTYFVPDDELGKLMGISVGEADLALTNAWLSWALVCDIVVTRVGRLEESNVLVNVKMLENQPLSVLALADVGPPGTRRLELSFDKSENWSKSSFEATACHEIGHLLGIRHIGKPRQLMNDTLHEDILTPQKHDIAAAVAIWGEK
ncbi:MAG: matrixin family metalloprotease, partial [Pirellulales bacterium]|nr:matrixin family metalloprotease [Pirellulales bacterium]